MIFQYPPIIIDDYYLKKNNPLRKSFVKESKADKD
jgi:hypothetical protein